MPAKRINVTGTSVHGLHNANRSDTAVIHHLANADGPLLIHDGKLRGTELLFAIGLYACDTCGHINPIDRHDCKNCHEPKFINLKS
jgi:hypothetical protein